MTLSGRNKEIRHSRSPLTVTIALNAAVSGVLDIRNFAWGGVIMDSGWTAADLGVQVCDTSDGTFVPLADRENGYGTDVNVDSAAASTAYPIPPFAFAWPFIKLWSNDGAGSGVNQLAARTLTVVLKT